MTDTAVGLGDTDADAGESGFTMEETGRALSLRDCESGSAKLSTATVSGRSFAGLNDFATLLLLSRRTGLLSMTCGSPSSLPDDLLEEAAACADNYQKVMPCAMGVFEPVASSAL